MKWPAKPIVAIGNTWLPCAADEDPTLGSLRHLAAGREGSTRIFLTPGNSIGEDVDGEPMDRQMGNNLHHVVLTSGRVQRLERSVEAEARINMCANLLSEALAGGEPTVPGIVAPVSMSAIDGEWCI